jgi:hypothetical protein
MANWRGFLVSGALLVTIRAADPAPPANAVTNLLGTNLVRAVAPGLLELGLVRLNQQERSVTFPAELNTNDGLLEYLLVTTSGKTHESLLRTRADPLHIQLSLLLLNGKPGEFQIPKSITSQAAQGDKGELTPINDPSPVKLSGDPVQIEISWEHEGKKQVYAAEGLLMNANTKLPISNPKWIFNGSRSVEGKFMGQVTGSIISLITDPDAIVNNQAPGHENDEIWGINAKVLPAVNHPVFVTIRLPKEAAPAKPQ